MIWNETKYVYILCSESYLKMTQC
uniref:Uncharacterized protein n=1 Tax=Arundo donax TaxID=35708 RepID=A0A0A8Y805_ARUDO